MTFLPIVGRELGVAARRPATYWLRFGAVLGTLLLFGILLTQGDSMFGAAKGVYILNALGVLALGFCLLAGVFQTADCLSEEIREGTMGLLFLTDLKAYDVVLGKLVASSINVFFGLLAIFPVLGMAMLVGGVTGPEFCRLQMVFINTLFFSLGVGMFVSSTSRDARQAIMRTFLIVLMFGGVLPLVWWLHRISGMTTNLDWVLIPSPVYGYMKAFEARYNYADGPSGYWTSLGTVFGIGLLGIVVASIILPRTWQDKGTVVPKRKRKERQLERPRGESDNQRLSWLRSWNPMYWLAARDSASHRIAVKALLLLVPLWMLFYVACYWVKPRAEIPFIICMFFAYGLHLIIKALIATEASRRINEDRQSGALELLLVTPLPVRDILSGQMKALRHHFKGPVAILLLLNLALCWMVVSNPKELHINVRDTVIFFELFVGGSIMLVLDFYTLGWVGMWRGLNATKHHRAVVGTVLRVMGVPWLFIFFLVFLRMGFRGPEGPMAVFAIWFLTGAVVDVIVGVVARQRLHALFRWTAASRFRRG